MAEPVRLVVWDLDDTFWKGTVTEGGLQEYVRAHHDIVIELARRGIMSSVCSRNDSETVRPILQERGILDYFIFPSITWDPKGARLAKLIEKIQLRPASVMFLDDNANNRAEAREAVPGLQVENETFIPKILSDPRFKGSDDAGLARLRHYKLLEKRKYDEEQTAGNNEDFLRRCNIRVQIEFDVEAHIDRAVELINRTNQLNYTKLRLPEDTEATRRELRNQLMPFDRVAGLVRVIDDYGDYGFVGFFMHGTMRKKFEAGAANTNLIHFCFSCRTLGMLVEQWVYQYLGRPEIEVVGDVLTPLSNRRIDWIHEIKSVSDANMSHAPFPQVAEQIVLFGGCEANSIGTYLKRYTGSLKVYGNYVANGIMTRVNYAARMVDIADRDPVLIADELQLLGLPNDAETGDMFADAPQGSLFVVNFGIDADGGARLRHKVHGWTFIFEPRNFQFEHIFASREQEVVEILDRGGFVEAERAHILKVHRHLRLNYEKCPRPDDLGLVAGTRQVIERIPDGSKLIILVEQEFYRHGDRNGKLTTHHGALRYRELVEELATNYPYVATIPIAECICSKEEILEANHYQRAVYHRVAQRIIETATRLKPRSTETVPAQTMENGVFREMDQASLMREAQDFVRAAHQILLRRSPEPDAVERDATRLVERYVTAGDYLRSISHSNEFSARSLPVDHSPLGQLADAASDIRPSPLLTVNASAQERLDDGTQNSPREEPVRFVIWDLDDTFWHGTLTEGGITLRPDTCDIVKELARRGIVSSICSKNDFEQVRNILQESGIWEYFVLPSISWAPKGARIAALIETIQLRPATVLFIDDNPNNLEEARHYVPALQTRTHECIPALLSDPLLSGKEDLGLTRLAQYKMLQQRKTDEASASGDNTDFLRASHIQVRFDYEVMDNLDRAVELINRTNQLNFTKLRLPEDREKARSDLAKLLSSHEVRVALVGVSDKYGDHGWCGIYVLHNNGRLIHFAFSCRILGLGVETWLYNRLGRPHLDVKGDVLVDVKREGAGIDWIGVDGPGGGENQRFGNLLMRVVARGGCDLMPVSHYFGTIADEVIGEFNENRFGMDGRIDHSAFLDAAFSGRLGNDAITEARKLGYRREDFESALTTRQKAREAWLLSFWTDAAYVVYRHRRLGFVVPFSLNGYHDRDARKAEPDALKAGGANQQILAALSALKSDYDYLGFTNEKSFKTTLRRIFSAASRLTQVFVIGANEYFIGDDGTGQIMHLTHRHNFWISEVAVDYPNVTLVNIRDFVSSEAEVHEPYHFDRMVYYRLFDWLRKRLEKPDGTPYVSRWAIHDAQDLDRALAKTQSAHALSRAAKFLMMQGRHDHARRFARKAVDLAPTVVTHLLAFAEAVLAAKDHSDLSAIMYLMNVAASLPAATLHRLGVLLMEAGFLDEAARFFERAAEAEPGQFHHLHRLANVYEKLGRPDETYAILKSCLDQGDSNPHVMAHVVRLLIGFENFREARLLLSACIKTDGNFIPFREAEAALDGLERAMVSDIRVGV